MFTKKANTKNVWFINLSKQTETNWENNKNSIGVHVKRFSDKLKKYMYKYLLRI